MLFCGRTHETDCCNAISLSALPPKTRHLMQTGHIPYIATSEGWLYLAGVINPFNWQFVGRSMHAHI